MKEKKLMKKISKKNEFLKEIKLFLEQNCGLDKNINPKDLIFSTNKIDSLNILKLVEFLENFFNITISPLDVGFKNFDSFNKIINFLETRHKISF